MSQAAATALAVIDGAAAPLTPSQVSDRVLIPSATMTATLDLLERRGWIRRTPNPGDRRSVLIEITPDGRATADQLLPGIRAIERSILSALTQELTCLTCSLAAIAGRPADGRRRQPPGSPWCPPRLPPIQPPVSQARHRAFARTIWCGVRQDTRMRSGLATMMARALAREVATFSRCGS